uniref:Uncharacterized protein n=1 Tax=Oryza barthii TaxID=65489 RepID=A0A0D3GPU2_9ORYZ
MARPPGFQSCGCGIRSGKVAARPAAMAQRGRRAAQEEERQRQRQGGMNGTTAVQACSTKRRQQASGKPTSQASITPSTIAAHTIQMRGPKCNFPNASEINESKLVDL